MAPGEVLELLSSDPISWWELPAWLEVHGHRLLLRERRGLWPWRSYRFLIQRGTGTRAGFVSPPRYRRQQAPDPGSPGTGRDEVQR